MICVVEGNEAVGKTTLSHSLKKTWESLNSNNEAIIVHVGPPGSWDENEMSLENWRRYCFLRIKAVFDMVEPYDSRKLLIVDRAHFGSPIYGRLFRPQVDHDGFGDLGRKYFYTLDKYLADRGGITLHINPPLGTVISRSIGREDEYLDEVPGTREQQLTDIHNEYESFIAREKDNLYSFAGSGVFTSLKAISRLPGFGDIAPTATIAADTTGNNNG